MHRRALLLSLFFALLADVPARAQQGHPLTGTWSGDCLMANSDNVIRAGLTPKHIDVPELVRVLDPEVAVPILTARQVGAGIEEFETPVPEFRLRRLTVDSATSPLAVPGDGLPRILLCVEGAAMATSGDQTLELRRGQSCYLSAADVHVTLTGDATLFLASPGE